MNTLKMKNRKCKLVSLSDDLFELNYQVLDCLQNLRQNSLTLRTRGKFFSRQQFEIFFLIVSRKRNLTFHAIVSSIDNAHDISKPVFWEKLETIYLTCQNRFFENISANAQTDLNLRLAHV